MCATEGTQNIWSQKLLLPSFNARVSPYSYERLFARQSELAPLEIFFLTSLA